MISETQTTHLSKLLSYILRHKPGDYEIVLDENGYSNVDELINKLNAHNENIGFENTPIHCRYQQQKSFCIQ